jgi:hypothetical protein
MKTPKYRANVSILLRISLGLLALPLLLGFGFPDSTGTQVKISGGGGNYRFSPGCSRFNYVAHFQETEIALQHRIAIKPTDGVSPLWSKLAPSHIHFGANGGIINKQIEVLGYDSTTNEFGQRRGPGPNEPRIGSRNKAIGFVAGAKVGLDWRWVGTVVGVSGNNYSKGDTEGDNRTWGRIPKTLPILGLRLGNEDLIYVSGELMGSSPIASGGGALNLGVGGRVGATQIWGGIGGIPYEGEMAIIKVSQPLGPVNLSFAGSLGVMDIPKIEEYGFAFGVGFRLP